MAELVAFFVSELPTRVEAIQSAWRARQIDTLTRLVHQLKGASAGYGFDPIGDAARAVELRLRGDQGPTVESTLAHLADLCARACRMR
jgi:HPt (histidine-containing phosphotransfer) domain-containing protein